MSWGAQLPPFWDKYWPIVKVMDEIQAMILSKRNNHTSNKSKKAIESKTQANTNIKDLFRGSSHRSTSPPSPLWRISLSSKGSSTKGLQLRLHKIGVHNSTTQPSTQEVAQSQLRWQSFWWSNMITNTLSYNFLQSRIWSVAQEVKWEIKFS